MNETQVKQPTLLDMIQAANKAQGIADEKSQQSRILEEDARSARNEARAAWD